MAMGLVGITGFGYLTGFAPALKLVGQTTMRTVTDYSFGVIPMFLLMGAFVSVSGISRELFRAANTFVGHWKGGLGIATIAACGGFAAISGSSVATAATFSAVAYPEMRRFGYPQSFATGVIAVGGTLGSRIENPGASIRQPPMRQNSTKAPIAALGASAAWGAAIAPEMSAVTRSCPATSPRSHARFRAATKPPASETCAR